MDVRQELELYKETYVELELRGYNWDSWGHPDDTSPCCLGGALEIAYDRLVENGGLPPDQVKVRLMKHIPAAGSLPKQLLQNDPDDTLGVISDATFMLVDWEVLAALDRAIKECESELALVG